VPTHVISEQCQQCQQQRSSVNSVNSVNNNSVSHNSNSKQEHTATTVRRVVRQCPVTILQILLERISGAQPPGLLLTSQGCHRLIGTGSEFSHAKVF
jgi:hypothetical protein